MTARTFKSTAESKTSQWLGTHNNPSSDMIPRDYLEKWFTAGKARYVNGQLEKGEEGTTHIQFYLNFENPVRLSALKNTTAERTSFSKERQRSIRVLS